MIRFIKNILRKFQYNLRGNKVSLNVKLNKNTYLEGKNVIFSNSDISGTYIGLCTYIGIDSELINSKIGRFCSIAPRVKIVQGYHPTKDFLSTHPAFFSIRKQLGYTFVDTQKFTEFRFAEDNWFVTIGNDVWIGSDVIILSGVKIGDGAIIGSGCVVSKDVEPYSIVVGNPMQVIRYRFTQDKIKEIIKHNIWSHEYEWYLKNSEIFSDISLFYKYINKH